MKARTWDRVAGVLLALLATGCSSNPTEPTPPAAPAVSALAKPSKSVRDATQCNFCGTTGTGIWTHSQEQVMARCALYPFDTNRDCIALLGLFGLAGWRAFMACVGAAGQRVNPMAWTTCASLVGTTGTAYTKWESTPGNRSTQVGAYPGGPLWHPNTRGGR